MNLDSPENPPEPERAEIASRMLARGYDPTIAYELTQEGVSELKRRLNELELKEENFFSRHNFISMLMSRKKRQLPLLHNDLPKDPARVKELKIESLKEECIKLAGELVSIDNQIELTSNRENSEDQLANLENIKAPIEEEFNQKAEEFNRLRNLGEPIDKRPYGNAFGLN